MSYEVIAALGDSITNGYWDEEGRGGWFGRLQQLMAPAFPYRYGFNNMAQDGYRSIDILHTLRAEVMARAPDIVLVMAGINDLIRWGNSEAPLEIGSTFRDETWERIFHTLDKLKVRAAVISILPIIEKRYPNDGGGGRPLYHMNADVEDYNKFLQKSAAVAGCNYIDVYAKARSLKWEDYVYDGGHPNARGHQFVAEQVFAGLNDFGWLKR